MKHYKSTQAYILDLAKDSKLAVVSCQMAAATLGLSKITITRQIRDGSLEAIKIDNLECVLARSLIKRINYENNQVRIVNSCLLKFAKNTTTTTYEPVMAAIGLATRSPPNRARIGVILGEISRNSHKDDNFMLSALVYNKNLGRPSESFYELAKELYKTKKLAADFLEKELSKIWKKYGSN